MTGILVVIIIYFLLGLEHSDFLVSASIAVELLLLVLDIVNESINLYVAWLIIVTIFLAEDF